MRPSFFTKLFVFLALCVSTWLFSGCATLPQGEVALAGNPEYSHQMATTSPCTEHLLSKDDMLKYVPHAFLGDLKYAEVNSAWLPVFYEHYRAELFKSGIMKWDTRFTCKHYAAYYAAMAQASFYYTQFHTYSKADTLAIGTFWYIQPDGRGHAIVVALTDKGPIFIEPQNGKQLALTDTERSSAFLKIF